jgi:hypothetical protein
VSTNTFEISHIIWPIKVQIDAQSIMIWVISWMLFNNNFVFHIQWYIAMINTSTPIMGWISHQLHHSFTFGWWRNFGSILFVLQNSWNFWTVEEFWTYFICTAKFMTFLLGGDWKLLGSSGSWGCGGVRSCW